MSAEMIIFLAYIVGALFLCGVQVWMILDGNRHLPEPKRRNVVSVSHLIVGVAIMFPVIGVFAIMDLASEGFVKLVSRA